jgi:nitrite reductase (NADH) small subunit
VGLLSWARWVAVGRRDGLRARVRRALGVCTWLDRGREPRRHAPEPTPEPSAEPVPEAPAAADLTGWVRVLDVAEVPPGQVVEVLAGDRAVAVANVDGQIFAVDSVCPHAGGPLGDGHLDGCTLTCPWHGWTFDVRDGSSELAADVRVGTFEVHIEDGAVWLQAAEP